MTREHVLIGFGSNQGDSVRICREAVEALRLHPQIDLLKVSSLYRTKPVGPVSQGWFINGAFECETSLGAEQLLEFLIRIEKDFGRIRNERWGPRTLDLDILFFGSEVIKLPHLLIPHPRIGERLFVLAPLAEIAPQWVHPQMNVTIEEMLARFHRTEHDQEIERLLSP